jgi:hypothetical protein
VKRISRKKKKGEQRRKGRRKLEKRMKKVGEIMREEEMSRKKGRK